MGRNIRVLVVDDSAVVRALLSEGLGLDPGITVVGSARDAYEARDMIVQLTPDVMTLDVDMPRMDGVDFLRRLMPQYPIPVVMVSSHTERGQAITLDALSAGAVDFVAKPSGAQRRGVAQMMLELRTKVKVASTADLRRWKRSRGGKPPATMSHSTVVEAIAIGASTGGTEAIRTVLSALPARSPGILIVQHMPVGFTAPFARMLDESCLLACREAAEGDPILPGTALVAPAGRQCRVVRRRGRPTVTLGEEARQNGHAPSVDIMMQSIASAIGKHTIGVLLTGMGADGAQGMLEMRRQGAFTVAQDESTSVVYGMPKEAWQCGGAAEVQPLERIAPTILDATKGGRHVGHPGRNR